MTRVARNAPAVGANLYNYHYALFDESGNEMCRVLPNLHEPEYECRARADSIAVMLDFGYEAAGKHARRIIDGRAKAENACNKHPG